MCDWGYRCSRRECQICAGGSYHPVGAKRTRETKGSRSRTGSAFSPILANSPSNVGAASKLSVLNGVLTPLDPSLTLLVGSLYYLQNL